MKYFDKTFFKFLFGFALILAVGIMFLNYAHATELVNINTASSEELQTLNGIGPSYATRIITYRTSTPFKTIEEIKNVSGIGDVTYNKIKDFITVGDTGSTQTNTSTTTQTTSTPTYSNYTSSSVTSVEEKVDFKIGAGRDRLAAVGVPIEFKATANSDSAKVTYTWTFGDGAVAYGEVVKHTYAYAGEYVVAVSAMGMGTKVVSRTNVKVVEANISINQANSERIEVMNNSKSEINLYGRVLGAQGKTFTFPEDTIIKAGQKISFPNSVTHLTPASRGDVVMMVIGENGKAMEVKPVRVATPTNTSNLATPITAVSTQEVATTTSKKSSGFARTIRHFFGFK